MLDDSGSIYGSPFVALSVTIYKINLDNTFEFEFPIRN